jgi:L-ascorbate metabolism protein UlaG (beta-lactamase superfamily)
LIPIGGQHSLDVAQATEVISQVEPRIVIPMHYIATTDANTGPLSKFCREMGVETLNPQPKLVVTRNNLPLETQVVILTPRVNA